MSQICCVKCGQEAAFPSLVGNPFTCFDCQDPKPTACRRCSECVGQDHHWMEDWDEVNHKGILSCKHCDITKDIENMDY